jgi:hypothetical protein
MFWGKATEGYTTELKPELSYWERHQADWKLPKAAEAVVNDVRRGSYLQGDDTGISTHKRKRNDDEKEDKNTHSTMRGAKLPKRRGRSLASESSSPV